MLECMVTGCKNKRGEIKGKGFFQVPNAAKNPDKRELAIKWLKNFWPAGRSIDKFPFGTNKVLCEDHFEPWCFNTQNARGAAGLGRRIVRKTLVPDAYPTIFSSRRTSTRVKRKVTETKARKIKSELEHHVEEDVLVGNTHLPDSGCSKGRQRKKAAVVAVDVLAGSTGPIESGTRCSKRRKVAVDVKALVGKGKKKELNKNQTVQAKETGICSKRARKASLVKMLDTPRRSTRQMPSRSKPSSANSESERLPSRRKRNRHVAQADGALGHNKNSQAATESDDKQALSAECDHRYSVKLEKARDRILALENYCTRLTSDLFFERFLNDPEHIEFYTGFCDYATFKAVFLALQPTGNIIRWSQVQRYCIHGLWSGGEAITSESLPFIDQFFMFMCHVRQGFCEQDLAVRFNISPATVTRILLTWINYLYILLSSLKIWPSRKCINENMPGCFKNIFPNTRIILNSTEVTVQMQRSDSEIHPRPNVNSTYKGLLGLSPFGAVTFVSDLYSGCTSDAEVINVSGIMNLLYNYDTVMAHDTFSIKEVWNPQKAKILVPPFWQRRLKPSSWDVFETCEMSQLRSYVEGSLRHVKGYRIFDSVIPVSLAESVNQLWVVCSLLANFKRCL